MPTTEMSSEPSELSADEEPLLAVFYGEFGRGKTTLAASFPKPLFIDTNRGMVTVALAGKRPMRFEPTGYEDLEALYLWVRDEIEKGDYKTIVIDSLDSLVFLLMDEMTEDMVSEKQATGKKVSLRMRFVPEQGDHYGTQRQMQRFLTALRRLGCHIIITSGMRETNGQTGLNVSPGMDRVVSDFASVIGEIIIVDEVDEEDLAANPELFEGCRVLFTEECNTRSTKSRFDSLKPFVVLPKEGGFDKLWDLIEAEYASAQAPVTPKRRARKPAATKAGK